MDMREDESFIKLIEFFNTYKIEYYIDEQYADESKGENIDLVIESYGFPLHIHFNIYREDSEVVAYCWIGVRAHKFMFENDTSDCTDLISNFMAILFSYASGIEVVLSDVGNFTMVPGEIYGRIITFIDKRYSVININSLDIFIELLKYIEVSYGTMCSIVNMKPYCNDFVDITFKDFKRKIEKFFKDNYNDESNVNYIQRKNEDWEWFYNEDIGVSSMHFKNNIGDVLGKLLFDDNEVEYLTGINRTLVFYDKYKKKAIDTKKLDYALSLLGNYDEHDYTIVAIWNKFFVLTSNTIVSIFDNCGLDSVNEEERLIRERRKKEENLLFDFCKYRWNDKIDGGRFEDFIREILSKEPYIKRVRKAGPTNQPDNGVDLIIEYIYYDDKIDAENENPYRVKKIIGQCKAYKNTVGKKDVSDIRDTLDYYDADGYWLFTSSQVSVHLTEYLQKMREKGNYFVEWWNRDEIEDILGKYPEVIVKYSDVVEKVDID